MVGERGRKVGEASANGALDAIDERRQLVGCALRGRDLRFERLDPRGTLLQLGNELGNLVRERDRFREPLLLGANRGQLRLERRDVEFAASRSLRRNEETDTRLDRLAE